MKEKEIYKTIHNTLEEYAAKIHSHTL